MATFGPEGRRPPKGFPINGRTFVDLRSVQEDLTELIFYQCTFKGVTFEECRLNETLFAESRMDGCSFVRCDLSETRFFDCQGDTLSVRHGCLFDDFVVSQCRFDSMSLYAPGKRSLIAESEIGELQFLDLGVEQYSLTLSDCRFKGVLVDGAKWDNCSCLNADLSVWSMDGAVFKRCNFILSEVEGKDFSTVSFEQCNFFQSNMKQVKMRSINGSIFAECQLDEADFKHANADGALFGMVQASKARFDHAKLNGAMFPKAILTGAVFTGCAASMSAWVDADLTDASMDMVDAPKSSFHNAVLDNTDVNGSSFVNCDLHGISESDLTGADTRNSRRTTEWRAEQEATVESFRQGKREFSEEEMKEMQDAGDMDVGPQDNRHARRTA